MKNSMLILLTSTALLVSGGVLAQRSSPDPLPIDEPLLLTTAEVPKLRVVPLVTGLANPYAMAFRDNGDILVTERYSGRLRLIRDGRLVQEPILGVPQVYGDIFRAGLMDVVLHPEDDSLVYLTYTKPITVGEEATQTVALARGRLVEDRLTDVQDIFVAKQIDEGIAGSVMHFAPDNTLFVSVGGAYAYQGIGELAQDPAVHYGKLLRLNDDGSAAADNPFVDSGEYLPEVYSVGHRNQMGLTFHPQTGALWASENGPQGGDEINIIEPGQNYGWPLVSFSRHYRGDWIAGEPGHASFRSPEVLFWPSIAPSEITFYTGDRIPAWQGNLFVGSMMTGRIPGTGHLVRIVFNSRGQEIRRENLLTELRSRIREVQQGPDGFLYVLTDEDNGALLRLEAVPAD
jgi:glucose/arabinose dehydrogenase